MFTPLRLGLRLRPRKVAQDIILGARSPSPEVSTEPRRGIRASRRPWLLCRDLPVDARISRDVVVQGRLSSSIGPARDLVQAVDGWKATESDWIRGVAAMLKGPRGI